MTIIASGMYGLTEEKQRIDTLGISAESETLLSVMLCTDSYAPDFDTHDFRNDVTNEIGAGGGYATGGIGITGTEYTIGSPAAGTDKYDFDDPSWAASTIVNAMADVVYFEVGTAATDPIWFLQDFVTAVTTSNGLLLISVHANGAVNIDRTP